MYDVWAGLVIGAIVGSLATALYIGVCHSEDSESWIDEAIDRAFLYVGWKETSRDL
jgi:hypothetical protein